MRKIRTYGSVGEREGNDPLYPETDKHSFVAFAFLSLLEKEGSLRVCNIRILATSATKFATVATLYSQSVWRKKRNLKNFLNYAGKTLCL